MHLPGLIRVAPEQTDIIDTLARMMGQSFLEEGWTQVWLSALDEIGTSKERKLEISQAIIRTNFTVGAPYNCVWALPDLSAAAGGYLSSDLHGRIWNDLEDESTEILLETVLSKEEANVLEVRAEQMEPISNFKWMLEDAAGNDYIHFFAIGVDPKRRGSGAFKSLALPFKEYADSHKLSCYLECYSDKTEQIYSHYGFEVVKRFRDPKFNVTERCMIRKPSA